MHFFFNVPFTLVVIFSFMKSSSQHVQTNVLGDKRQIPDITMIFSILDSFNSAHSTTHNIYCGTKACYNMCIHVTSMPVHKCVLVCVVCDCLVQRLQQHSWPLFLAAPPENESSVGQQVSVQLHKWLGEMATTFNNPQHPLI